MGTSVSSSTAPITDATVALVRALIIGDMVVRSILWVELGVNSLTAASTSSAVNGSVMTALSLVVMREHWVYVGPWRNSQLVQRGGRLRGDRHGGPRHSTHRQFLHTVGPRLLLGVDGSMVMTALDLLGGICPGVVGLKVL